LHKSKVATAVVCALSLLLATVVFGLCLTKKIEISDNGRILAVSVMGGTVADVLEQNGINLLSQDSVTPALTTQAKEAAAITIIRAMPISLNFQGAEKTVWTIKHTVGDILAAAGITLTEKDVVQPALDSVLEQNGVITVTSINQAMVTTTESIPFDTVTRPSYSLQRGLKKVAVEGVNGSKEVVYSVVTQNSVEKSRQLVGEKVIQKPVSRVVDIGMISTKAVTYERTANLASRGDIRYRTVLQCVATAYDNSGGSGRGITASGMRTRHGVVAVDPRVIPLGTKLFIESSDGKNNYGYAVAADTGGAIKGNRVDLYMESNSEAKKWGRRTVKVYVLDE